MNIAQALVLGAKKLEKSKSTSPNLDAELLLSFVLNKPKEYLYINPEKVLLRNMLRNYDKLLDKRAQGWPAAYLIGHKEFYGLDFYVNKDVLIPRPETEGLVDLVIENIQRSKIIDHRLRILDIGTGSGCIIVSIAKHFQSLPSPLSPHRFFASDNSTKALSVAGKNARRHKVKITFKQGSLLQPWKGKQFDIIIANLPYLAREFDASTKFEPMAALVAKKNGLALFEELFKQIAKKITTPTPSYIKRGELLSNSKRQTAAAPPLNIRGGWEGLLPKALFLEIGHNQGPAIKKMTTKYLPEFEIKLSKDLSDRLRYAVITKNPA